MTQTFDLVAIAIGDYALDWEPLPVDAPVRKLVDQLLQFGAQPWSGAASKHHSETSYLQNPQVGEARAWLAEWSEAETTNRSLLYWAGHGALDADRQHWLVCRNGKRELDDSHSMRTRDLAGKLRRDWERRRSDPTSWTVVVLDCCQANIGIQNLLNELTSGLDEPRRYALFGSTDSGAAFAGRFADACSTAFRRYTGNDYSIPLMELLCDIQEELGADLRFVQWKRETSIANATKWGATATVAMEALGRLEELLSQMTPELRAHFFAKAQGAELDEAGWYFQGRRAESLMLVRWLQESTGGLKVVSGRAGEGKSALLGRIAVLSDPHLERALVEAGWLSDVSIDERPPSGCFSLLIHLTGKSLAETLVRISTGLFKTHLDQEAILLALHEHLEVITLLFDALDEAQEPTAIATLLRRISRVPGVRVLVGTRRSLNEGPDQPQPERHELLVALQAARQEVVYLDRDPIAVADYVTARLTNAPQSPFCDQPELVQYLARRVASIEEQPFLFARLAVTELLASPQLASNTEALGSLLRGGHRGLFASAIDRIRVMSPQTYFLLGTLAYSLGRGFPRTGGVWAGATTALHPSLSIGESDIDLALVEAAAFITLDGDAGQSTYRLAHQTFVEYFRAELAL